MGEKDDQYSRKAEETAEHLLDSLEEIGDITSKKMFGGIGVFHNGKMFGIIDSDGSAFLKANDFLEERFSAAGSEKHGQMPYYSIPENVMNDVVELVKWAKDSIRAVEG